MATPGSQGYETPVVYLGRRNGDDIVLRMSWKEAAAFVEPLAFENFRFKELVAIVMREGLKLD